MIRSSGSKLAWLHCIHRHVASSGSMRCTLCVVARGGSLRRRGALILDADKIYGSSGLALASVDVFGRDYDKAHLSGLSNRVRRNSLAFKGKILFFGMKIEAGISCRDREYGGVTSLVSSSRYSR